MDDPKVPCLLNYQSECETDKNFKNAFVDATDDKMKNQKSS